MEEGAYRDRVRLTTIWEERRVITILFFIASAQFQYGYDSAAVSGFQSMAGFLRVYGYPDVRVMQRRAQPVSIFLISPIPYACVVSANQIRFLARK